VYRAPRSSSPNKKFRSANRLWCLRPAARWKLPSDKDQLPSRALEPRAFDSLAMGEVVSVSEFAAEVKLKTSAKINNPSQWMAVPYMP